MTGRLPLLKAREVMRALERGSAATAYISIATIQPVERLLPTTVARTFRVARCAGSSTKPVTAQRDLSLASPGVTAPAAGRSTSPASRAILADADVRGVPTQGRIPALPELLEFTGVGCCQRWWE